jgi:hypothetical protein
MRYRSWHMRWRSRSTSSSTAKNPPSRQSYRNTGLTRRNGDSRGKHAETVAQFRRLLGPNQRKRSKALVLCGSENGKFQKTKTAQSNLRAKSRAPAKTCGSATSTTMTTAFDIQQLATSRARRFLPQAQSVEAQLRRWTEPAHSLDHMLSMH